MSSINIANTNTHIFSRTTLKSKIKLLGFVSTDQVQVNSIVNN